MDETVPLVTGRVPRCACNRCELMGRKNACAVRDGICDLLSRLPELPGLLVTWLGALIEFRVAGGPRLDETEGRDWSGGGGDV